MHGAFGSTKVCRLRSSAHRERTSGCNLRVDWKRDMRGALRSMLSVHFVDRRRFDGVEGNDGALRAAQYRAGEVQAYTCTSG